MKLVIYCTCGDWMSVETNTHNTQKLLAIWKTVHNGPGHAECDAETARKARDLAEHKTAGMQ